MKNCNFYIVTNLERKQIVCVNWEVSCEEQASNICWNTVLFSEVNGTDFVKCFVKVIQKLPLEEWPTCGSSIRITNIHSNYCY